MHFSVDFIEVRLLELVNDILLGNRLRNDRLLFGDFSLFLNGFRVNGYWSALGFGCFVVARNNFLYQAGGVVRTIVVCLGENVSIRVTEFIPKGLHEHLQVIVILNISLVE